MSGQEITIPIGPEANLAGCIAATRKGATLASERVKPSDFYDPKWRRILEVSTDPQIAASELGATPGEQEEARLAAFAELANVDLGLLRAVAADRPCHADVTGSIAYKVRAASLRREIMIAAADAHEAGGEGRLEDIEAAFTRQADALSDLRTTIDTLRLIVEEARLTGNHSGSGGL